MSNQKRLAIEVSVALILILACFAVWSVSQSGSRRQLAELQARQESATYQMRQQCEARAVWLATSEATDAFRAFAAGIQGAALRQQKGILDMAKTSLLRMPYVAFVHVLEPDGKVLTSSDEKYSVAGRAGARASWALQATEMQTRPGDLPGTIEIAAPFQEASGHVAVLWLAYKTRELLAASAQQGAPGR